MINLPFLLGCDAV